MQTGSTVLVLESQYLMYLAQIAPPHENLQRPTNRDEKRASGGQQRHVERLHRGLQVRQWIWPSGICNVSLDVAMFRFSFIDRPPRLLVGSRGRYRGTLRTMVLSSSSRVCLGEPPRTTTVRVQESTRIMPNPDNLPHGSSGEDADARGGPLGWALPHLPRWMQRLG